MPLPNLIVIGAQKCGTTSLHHYLGLHPEIAMADGPTSDEVHFFSHEDRWRRGADWYSSLFREAPVRGEVSVSYSAFPLYPWVPERLARALPGARLVYLVRDPIDRLVSEWHQNRLAVAEARSFDETFATLDDSSYVAKSRYGLQLERFLEHVPQERILVVDSHDLGAARTQTLRQVFGFVGVDDSFTSPGFEEEHNVTERARPLSPGGRTVMLALHRTVGHRATHAVASRVPFRLPFVEVARPEQRPAVPDELRERLVEYLAPEVDRLRALTGLRLASWSL